MSDPLIEYEKFKPAKWAGLSPSERLELLKKVEDRVAAEEHRISREIVPVKMDDLGKYDPDDPFRVYINENLVNTTWLDGQDENGRPANRPGYTVSMALSTVYHEGRHAFQDDCVKGCSAVIDGKLCADVILREVANIDSKIVNLWAMNYLKDVYADYSDQAPPDQFLLYFFQPIEDDAESFAIRKLLELAEQVDDHDFWAACGRQVETYKNNEEHAAVTWKGPDFREKITQHIKHKYSLLLMEKKSEQETSNASAPKRKAEIPLAPHIPKDKPNLIRYALFGGILLYLLIMYLIASPSGLVSHLLWFLAAMIPFLPVILLLRFFPKLHNKKGGILLAAIFGIFLLLMQLFYSWLSLLFLVGTAWVLLKGLGSAAPNLLTITRENADGTTTTETRIVGDDMAAEIAGAKAQLRSEGYTDIREG